jgi:hypothetical protein
MHALSPQQRSEQGVLVFAVAILIVQNFGSRMRLIARHPQREADISEVRRNEVIECLRFF